MIYSYNPHATKFSKNKYIWCFGFCLCFFLSSNSLIAQNLKDFGYIENLSFQNTSISKNSSKSKISYPAITPYIGAGLLPGGRVGLIAKIIENISVEFSYGNDLRNFISLSDEETRMSIGANYHFSNLPIHLNFTYVYALKPRENHSWIQNPRYLYSLNLGYMPAKKGITPFARIGLYYETYLQNPENEIKSGSTFFNFDLGIGWTFSL